MNIEAHFLASWLVGAAVAKNPRDCHLITLAGVLPDLDGLSLLGDALSPFWGGHTDYYGQYHHFLLHGISGCIGISLFLACWAQEKRRVIIWAFALFHLHLLCDLVGSRGPDPVDLWPVYYFGPFTHEPMWIWKNQLPLDSWPNRVLATLLFLGAIGMAVKIQRSWVAIFSRRGDVVVVRVLTQWHSDLRRVLARLLGTSKPSGGK